MAGCEEAVLRQCVGRALLLLSRCATQPAVCVGPARLPGPARPYSSSSFSSSFSSCPRTGLAETGKAGTVPSMGPGGHLKHISTPLRLLFLFRGNCVLMYKAPIELVFLTLRHGQTVGSQPSMGIGAC